MRCEYCDVEVTEYPANGICVCCGGKLPSKPLSPTPPVHIPPQPVPVPFRQHIGYTPGINCCPKCHNTRIVFAKRDFSWGLGILGFFLIPVFGIFLGFCGSGKPRIRCTNCNHKWKRG